ncbi:MAG TPA: sulfite exporter TauE/SafE family protein [Gemmatimonadaceae bacterium]|nr:sulfite exporter TauE/SafE family protein [Gemmatimonadaceae bacterium]
MISPLSALLAALAVLALLFVGLLVRTALASPRDARTPSGKAAATGLLTAFFDTLGIGSFATTTSIFRHGRVVDDADIPGTLNVGIALPTAVQAFIYTRLIPVDARTLILMIVASVAGAWLGAGIVSRWPRVRIQVGMGTALIIAAAIMLGSMMALLPVGGAALALTGTKLVLGVLGNFVLGALMTLGIGLYAPCMILVSLLGLTPAAAFPIMMGSCAFLMPVASARFLRTGRYDLRAALGLAIGSIPGVLLAAFIVKSLPLSAVRWLVVVVVLYTAVTLLRAALRERVVAPLAPTPS